VFEDEASFRQDATLHATWSRRGNTPIVHTSSSRNSIKVYGCVEIERAKFMYQFADKKFNATTYINFLEKVLAKNFYPNPVIYIQDNASYHKDKDVWQWFSENSDWLFVKNLPPYCPELNATETIWHYTRVNGIHNQYFDSTDKIQMNLKKVFFDIKRNPKRIQGYLNPFL
jgi:transposase